MQPGLRRVGAAHHAVLIAVAAPLIAFASLRMARPTLGPAAAFTAHAVILWFWHAPAAYAWALDKHAIDWLMQATLLASAIVLWRAAFMAQVGEALTVLLGTTAHVGLLGALLLFAPNPLYAAHLFSKEVWGLSPLQDQQAAGLIMWVLASAPYLGVAAAIGWRAASPDGRRLA